MRRAGLLFVVALSIFAALPVTDTFTGVTGTPLPTYNASWVQPTGSFIIDSNAARPQVSANYSLDVWTGDSFNANQYAEATLGGLQTLTYVGPAVRMNSGTGSCYILIADGTDILLQKLTAGAFTSNLATVSSATTSGDVLRLEITGSNLTAKKNGSTVLTATDSGFATGAAGIAGYNLGNSFINTWTAGNLSSAATRRPLFLIK